MRASTLLVLTIAILIGVGVAVAARLSGIFRRVEATPPPAVETKVLVAGQNIFKGGLMTPNFVTVRNMTPEELEHYRQHKDEYLPATPNAIALRVADADIPTDQPILKKHLKPMELPSSLNTRLLPSMRAINLSVTKDKASGGLIRVGEWVDVLFTSEITDPDGNKTVRTAPLARRVRVIAKRNTLWPVFAPLDPEKPIPFTLELNPYRAALVEFAKRHGELTLTPLPESDQKKLEVTRTALLKKGGDIKLVQFNDDGALDAQAEEDRVAAYNRGELVIGEQDLIRLFDLKVAIAPTGPPPEKRVHIQQVVKTDIMKPATFTLTGQRIVADEKKQSVQVQNLPQNKKSGFQFGVADCPACEKINQANRQRSIQGANAAVRRVNVSQGTGQ
ncbi:MAG: Flp pilus assembly protein CpaB [Gemmataceae bacterium]